MFDHPLGSIRFQGTVDLFSKGKFKDWLDHGLTGLYVIYIIIYICNIIFTLDSFDSFSCWNVRYSTEHVIGFFTKVSKVPIAMNEQVLDHT